MARSWKHGQSVLVVEGYSDLLFFAELLESVGRNGVFIKDFGGKGNFDRTSLETLLTPAVLAGAPAIAAIQDADDDGAAAATSLRGALSAITSQAVEVGAWTVGTPRVGCFVVPGATRRDVGAVEALVWSAFTTQVDAGPVVACVDAYMACVRAHGLPRSHPDKARASALFAQLNPEDPRLGPTARTRRLDLTAAPYGPLRTFLSGFPA